MNSSKEKGFSIKSSLKITMVSMGVLFFLFLFFQQWFIGLDERLFEQIIDHYAVFLTIPCAAFGALLLVVIFDETYGNVKISIWQINFEGAAAPLILWIFCFLSIVFAIKMLW